MAGARSTTRSAAFPSASLMARMIIHSDNRATDILLKDLGGPSALHDWLKDNGVSGLRVDRTIAQLLGDRRDLWDRRDSALRTRWSTCSDGSTAPS